MHASRRNWITGVFKTMDYQVVYNEERLAIAKEFETRAAFVKTLRAKIECYFLPARATATLVAAVY